VSEDLLKLKMEGDTPAFGLWLNDVYMADLAAHMGFDWFMVDQMFTPTDWNQADQLLRAGEAAGITPVLRLQSNPWLGYNGQLAQDLTRALGIGYQYVMVSNSGKREVEECAKVAHDWHRKAMWVHPFGSVEEWQSVTADMVANTHVIPQPESIGGLTELESTLDIPGIDLAFIAMTDASKVLRSESSLPDFYDEKLWSILDSAVAKARREGKIIGANTSYAYDVNEISQRAVRLVEHGVRMIMLQGAGFLFQVAVGALMKEINDKTSEVLERS
jgi:2-keto-3-deoxy-L-rhamnonate aldolase RhmA